jgi:hypothetical protein
MRRNAEHLRGLAEKGLADLERKHARPLRRPGQSNADWLRELVEQAHRRPEARQ